MPAGNKLTPGHIEIEERDNNAVAMRLSGATFQQIADQLDYANRGAAHKGVTAALKRAAREANSEMLELELGRLDRLQTAHWVKAIQGDIKAAEYCLRVIDRRCKLLGLDAAIKIEQDIHIFDTREELEHEAEQIIAAIKDRMNEPAT